MLETPTPTPAVPPTRHILRAFDRIGGYVLVFSIVFAAMVWASVLWILPRFSTVEVLGAKYSVHQLPSLKADLLNQVTLAETKRGELVVPVQHAAYAALKDDQSAWGAMHVWNDVQRVITETSGSDRVLHFSLQQFDPTARTITLVGDVRNSGTQSMTVLAGFLDSLAKLPGIASLSPVPFTRDSDPRIGDFSPFAVTLTLQ